MAKTILLLSTIVLLFSCQNRPAAIEGYYTLGESRNDIHKRYKVMETKSIKGSQIEQDNYDMEKYAQEFESEKNVKVDKVDIIPVSRTAIGGLYFDYVYYDKNGKVLGYQRRYMD